MKQPCGCCEGTEQLTPASTVNRPGLGALAYRVGTHGSFLETMLARLSNHALVAPTGEEPPRPLQALTTRDARDASIAFLDAWATVADVLTFYQERIANEGYLRTATERRSLMELARLIGYRPRPGVAASVHLAYTLDEDSEVTIPAGSRSQSVPGPGELPQSFETTEDLAARAVWNLLQPRLTRPQDPRRQLNRGEALYFKGTATNLKPNDPLLVVAGEGANQQLLLRVLKAEPEQANDRTKVNVELWEKPPSVPSGNAAFSFSEESRGGLNGEATTGSAASSADAQATMQVEAAREIIERHRQTEAFDVNAGTATARRVLGHLDVLEKRLAASPAPAGLRLSLEEALTPLREQHRLALEGHFNKLEPWIASIVSGLEQVSASLDACPPDADAASSFSSSASAEETKRINVEPAATAAATTSQSAFESALENVSQKFLDDLTKPASEQPASRQHLGRGLADTFSPASGTLTKTLTALRPGLRDLFESSWGNVPVTERAAVAVFALRARASLFGSSAPLKTIFDDDNRVEGQEEWTLFRDIGEPTPESFIIAVGMSDDVGSSAVASLPRQTVVVEIRATEGTAQSPRVTFPLTNGHRATINVPAPVSEIITLDVSVTTARLVLVFSFQQREVVVSAVIQSGQSTTVQTHSLNAHSRGTNPTAFRFDPSDFRPAFISGETVNGYLVVEAEVRRTSGSTPTEEPRVVSLDASYKEILPGSWAAIERPTPLRGVPPRVLIRKVERVAEGSRADYGVSAKGTQLRLDGDWINPVV
ncbi:MAG TPA: hypothetical protein VFS10_15290, partial [Pyrinomonadaceae bacterium]|nr:hypothetical protein [Pyrinomonadaceae bacterium]